MPPIICLMVGSATSRTVDFVTPRLEMVEVPLIEVMLVARLCRSEATVGSAPAAESRLNPVNAML